MEIKRQFRAFDLFAFMFCTTVTLGVLFLPYVSGEEIRSSWLKLLVVSIPFFLMLWLISLFTKRYPDYDFFKALKDHLWGWLYFVVIFYFIIGTILSAARVTNGLSEIVQVHLLKVTPEWMVLLPFFIIAGVGVYYGIIAITRFAVYFVVLEILVLLSVIVMAFFQDYFKWIFVAPVFSTDVVTFLKSSVSDMARYAAIVPTLAFLVYMRKGEAILAPMNLSLIMIVIIYSGLSLGVLGTFGFDHAMQLLSPITALTQSIETRTGLLERLDLLFIGFWIVSFYKLFIVHTWFMVYITKKAWPVVNQNLFIVIYLAVIYMLSLMTPEFIIDQWAFHNINLILYGFVMPTLLLIFLTLKKKRGTPKDDTNISS
ncbi:GerAB/ArcD/ProY family transporter [Desertibacillus haloalkaliphilus]|uniref:GerAB/ArcD/ProY family transporter n=1 Tax=Desertibacillus haloalkaliphilus TaxID=1328930 RepID=UPI001C26880F|nr:GerAB/ArcD/ProY family transporter [Desertibacillus haloalkaliphilus]MBU8906873.1 spore germination protein [Desertibacillus haloalkaliphilus]